MSKKREFRFLQTIDRRSFLKYCAALGTGAVAGGVLQSTVDVMRIGSRKVKISESRMRMGTYVTITAIHDSRSLADEAIGRAFEEMDRLIGILSRHDSATPLSVLNTSGWLKGPPPELTEVMNQSRNFHMQTGGAFDITVGPLVELYREGGRDGRIPTDDEISEALARVGSDKIETRLGGLHLATPGMSVTLDGVAKGYIVDRTSETLVAHGIDNHLVNAGGDIRTRGHCSGGRPWTIAIEDPDKKANYRDTLHLTNGAVATSGDYEIYYDKERVFHHTVDPHTGRSPRHSTSVSVIAESVMRADALSTAVFVMGPTAGRRLIESLPSSECMLIDREGVQRQTRNWSSFQMRRSA